MGVCVCVCVSSTDKPITGYLKICQTDLRHIFVVGKSVAVDDHSEMS